MTSKSKRVQRSIEDAERVYRARIEQIAEETRQLLVPYFRKRGWSYRAGNGAWLIDHQGKIIEDDHLPRWVHDLLYTELSGGSRDPLGFYISDLLGFYISDI